MMKQRRRLKPAGTPERPPSLGWAVVHRGARIGGESSKLGFGIPERQ